MRARWSVPLCVLVALGLWALWTSVGPARREEVPVEPWGGSTPAAPSPDLAPRPAATAPAVVFEPPPAPSPGTRRLRLVGVGPPDRPAPDVAFEVWTYAEAESAAWSRRDAEPHPTAPNEAWFAVPTDASLVWFRATADRGRLVSQEGQSFDATLVRGADPYVVRVALFPEAELEVRVVDAGDLPIAGATVLDGRDVARGRPTDARGRTRIRGVAGFLAFRAVAAGHATSETATVTLAPGSREEKTLVCGPARALLGRAVDEVGVPLSGTVVGTSTNGREQQPLAADGSFRLDTLAFPADARASIRLGVRERGGDRSASASLPGPFPAGEGPVDLGVVRLVSRWRVPVRVASARGDSVVGVSVLPVRAGGVPDPADARLVTDEAGTTFWLADGTYDLRVKPFVVRAPATLEVHGAWRGPPAPIVLEDARVVRGVCVHHGGATPVWPLVMVRARAPKPEEDLLSRVDGTGRFSIALPEALDDAPLDVETPYAKLVPGLAAPKDGSDLVVDLPPDRTFSMVVRAVDAAGHPIPFRSARFEAVPVTTPLPVGWFTGPSADGETTFWPLPRGDYRVTVEPWAGSPADSGTVPLERDGQVVEVRFDR